MSRIVLRDRFYIPAELVDYKALRSVMEVVSPDKSECRPECPIAAKQGRWCSTCPSKDLRIKMWEKIETRKGRVLIAVPAGDSKLMRRVLNTDKFEIVDCRADIHMRSELRWTGKLRSGGINKRGEQDADQKHMLQSWIRQVRHETGGVIISPPRCVIGETLVLTSQGLTRIADWSASDHRTRGKLRGRNKDMNVVLESGSIARASNHFVVRPEHVKTVRLRGGLNISGTDDHPIMTLDGFRRLADIVEGDTIPVHFSQDVWGASDKLTPDLAKLLGFWVSEGSGRAHAVHITNYDQDVLRLCRDEMHRLSPSADIRLRHREDGKNGFRCVRSGDKTLHKVFDCLVDGTWRKSADKVIPRSVLESPREIVCAFLQALFEGDGSVGPRGIEYASLSHKLISQLQIVLSNLGIVCNVRQRMSWATNGSAKQVSKPYWSLSVRGRFAVAFRDCVHFFSNRKRAALECATAHYEELERHQPLWCDVYPAPIKSAFMTIVSAIDTDLSHLSIQSTFSNKLMHWPATFSSIVDHKRGARHGGIVRKLTRARLTFYAKNLQAHRHWYDLQPKTRSLFLAFIDQFLNSKCFWTTVVSVKTSKGRYKTYDFTVPGYHRFMSNGILSHNSGKCVSGDTMIRTSRGYQRIYELFADSIVDDCIGSFGTVSAPGCLAQVKGLHRRKAKELISVKLDIGISLRGTPEHPITILAGDLLWRPMCLIEAGDMVAIPPVCDPIKVVSTNGLSLDEATLMGHLTFVADYADILDGLINLRHAKADYPEALALARVLKSVTGLTLGSEAGASLNLKSYPRLCMWQTRLLASGDDVWRAFVSAALSSNFSNTPSVMLPDSIAEAMTYQLMGSGVFAILRKEPFGLVVIVNRTQLSAYIAGRRPPNTENGLFIRVASVSSETVAEDVFDLMVPETRAFVTNAMSSHNTVIGVGAVMAMRRRTLITASQSKFLHQFGSRFGELTNLRELYRRGKRPVVLIDPKGWSDGEKNGVLVLKKWGPDVDRADVILCAYQQLISAERGKERIRRHITGKIGNIVVDETHQCAAPCFSRIVNRLNVRFRLGLTATLKRKDGMEAVVSATLGRTAVIGRVTSTLPLIELLETGVNSSRNYSNWSAMETFLSKHEERNRIILRQVFHDLRKDHRNFILIPVTRVAHILELVRMINQQADYCRREKGENWPVDLAVAYRGGVDTTEVLNQVQAGRARVIVAMNSMVKYGLDVQRWTHVYIGVIPTSNAPNVYQALNRVCTPYSDETLAQLGPKPQPVVRVVIDEMSASVFCFAKIYKNSDYGLEGSFTGRNYFGVQLAKVRPEVAQRMRDIALYPKSYSAADAGVKRILGKTQTGRMRRKSAWTPIHSGITKL